MHQSTIFTKILNPPIASREKNLVTYALCDSGFSSQSFRVHYPNELRDKAPMMRYRAVAPMGIGADVLPAIAGSCIPVPLSMD